MDYHHHLSNITKLKRKTLFPLLILLLKGNFVCFKLFHTLTCLSLPMFFSSIFSCCIKSGNEPQEDLAKFDYKTNKEVENLGILLHVGEQLEPINGDFS